MAKSQTKLTTSRQEDLQSLLVGHLLFKSDILAINSALLPEQEVRGALCGPILSGCSCLELSQQFKAARSISAQMHPLRCVHNAICVQVQSIIQLHSQVLAYTEASDYLAALHHSGLQPGALLTGNNRVRLLQALSAGKIANESSLDTAAAQLRLPATAQRVRMWLVVTP